MSEATLIYPHQLFAHSPALSLTRPVYLIEESLLLTYNPIHRSKLLLHKLSLDAYQATLHEAGYTVYRLTIHEYPTTKDIFSRLQADGVSVVHVVDTSDTYLERALEKSNLTRIWYESPLFLLPKAEAVERFLTAKRHMASFYASLRKDRGVLLDTEGKPVGGKWSFDADNRQRLPRDIELPSDISFSAGPEHTEAIDWVDTVEAEKYGECHLWLPYTHQGAANFLQDFLQERLALFGPYEDALTTTHTRLWHSTLSPLINIGLLTPEQVLAAVLTYADTHHIPLNSLEGFVRQLIGWREFMRASYETDGSSMRQQNFWQHTRPLPQAFWDGTTGLIPVDHTISTALTYGYTHHIERLMVVGNCLLLCQTHPTEVYRWFMGMYIDAYDWVMVPNVYGMSQFADGGSFATKPYISGANYLKKMGDYSKGEWEDIWTSLYWHFIITHQPVFAANYRMQMMARLVDKMDPATRQRHLDTATAFFTQLS